MPTTFPIMSSLLRRLRELHGWPDATGPSVAEALISSFPELPSLGIGAGLPKEAQAHVSRARIGPACPWRLRSRPRAHGRSGTSLLLGLRFPHAFATTP